MPQFFPFPPWRIVLEEEAGTCDMFGGGNTCIDFSEGRLFEPEYHVREVVASFLYDCCHRECYSIDIGSNIGYFAGAMAALGSSVVAIERQTDLLDSFAGTACINGWSNRVTALNAWIGIDAKPGEVREVNVNSDLGRPISAGAALTRRQEKILPVLNIKDFVVGKSVDLIKIDIDSIEGLLLIELERLIALNQTSITAMAVELNSHPEYHYQVIQCLYRLQQKLGYHIYVLNMHLHMFFGKQRFFNESGKDITDLPSHVFPDVLEEVFFQRMMTHLLYVRPEVDLNRWSWVASGIQVVITKEFLQDKTARRMHPLDQGYFTQFGT